jgi:hypothetical protein
MSELDALDPVPEEVKLSTGTVVQLESLRSRQFFKLLRIITHGALPNLGTQILRPDDDMTATQYAGRVISILALSIPDAEDETIAFIRSMCKPAGLIEARGRLNDRAAAHNDQLWAQLDADLENPELDDLISIIEAIVKREAEDIQALGKRLAGMFRLAEKTGQVPTPTSQTETSSAASPEPSGSSPVNITGRTRTSRTSRSASSGSGSRRSTKDTSMPNTTESNG